MENVQKAINSERLAALLEPFRIYVNGKIRHTGNTAAVS
jgi:hypothetical protein